MVTKANLDAIRQADGIEWITALRAPQVKRLARTGAVQPSLFDEHNLAEIASDEFPGERLVVCRNPLVAAELHASARRCWPPPRPTSRRSAIASSAARCTTPRRSA